MSKFFKNKSILVTGGTGFIGSNLVDFLIKEGAEVKITSKNHNNVKYKEIEVKKGDLKNMDFCKDIVKGVDYVFHLAAEGFTSIANPLETAKNFTPNITINSNIFSACSDSEVSHVLFASSLNVYDSGKEKLSDEEPWINHPHPAQKYFAWSKRLGEMQLQAFHDLGLFKGAIVRIGAAYGPKDNFDISSARVIPSLIVKAFTPKEKFIVWGSGNAQRSFVHVNDIVDAMCKCMEKYSKADPINIGSKESTSIKELANLIINITGSKKKPFFDESKPEGIPKITISTEKAKLKIGWESKINLREGLKNTILWYRENILSEQ